eukprot:8004104-Alexandrium_andersonii.AAC.1
MQPRPQPSSSSCLPDPRGLQPAEHPCCKPRPYRCMRSPSQPTIWPPWQGNGSCGLGASPCRAVSYTHLTLPTLCSV